VARRGGPAAPRPPPPGPHYRVVAGGSARPPADFFAPLVAAAHVVDVGDRMRSKLDVPEVAGHGGGGGGHEDDLGPAETEDSRRLGEVTVVADQDADARERGVEGREAEIARREVVL